MSITALTAAHVLQEVRPPDDQPVTALGATLLLLVPFVYLGYWWRRGDNELWDGWTVPGWFHDHAYRRHHDHDDVALQPSCQDDSAA
jgi:hypothetical protein